jgi:F0F1-type ATP synthase assembly protein I
MEKTDWHDKISVSGVPAGMSVSLSVGGVGVGIVVGMAVSVLVGCVPLGMSVGGASAGVERVSRRSGAKVGMTVSVAVGGVPVECQ